MQCITVPTNGIFAESMLGQCSACEEFINKHREFDLQLTEQEVRQASLENDRRQARIEAGKLGPDIVEKLPDINADITLTNK